MHIKKNDSEKEFYHYLHFISPEGISISEKSRWQNTMAKTQELLNVYLIAHPSSVGPGDRDDICH